MEEKLIKEYIGKGANEITSSNLNWVAAVIGQSVGPAWFFYRKSYLLGFIFIIITFALGNIAASLNINKAYYIMFVIYLFTANKLYLWDVKRKVKKILEKNNMNMTEEELVEYTRKKGGTSVLAAVIYGVAFAIFMILYIALIVYVMTSALEM